MENTDYIMENNEIVRTETRNLTLTEAMRQLTDMRSAIGYAIRGIENQKEELGKMTKDYNNLAKLLGEKEINTENIQKRYDIEI